MASKSLQTLFLALVFLSLEVSSRGQIVGELNEVDSDNNIVGDQPFMGMTFPSKRATLLTKVKFFLSWVLTLLVIGLLIAASYFIYKRYWKGSQASSGGDSSRSRGKVMNKNST